MSVCCNPFGPTIDFLLFLHWRISMRSECNHLLLVYFYKWVVLVLKSHCGTFQTGFSYFKSAKNYTQCKHSTKRNQTLNVKHDHATFAKMHLEDDLKQHWICLPTVKKKQNSYWPARHTHTNVFFNLISFGFGWGESIKIYFNFLPSFNIFLDELEMFHSHWSCKSNHTNCFPFIMGISFLLIFFLFQYND